MNRRSHLLSSTIGTKLLMSVTGLALLAFVIAHMLGNLQVFGGPAQLNGYAKKLRDLGPLLWLARGGLLAVFVVHVVSAYHVWRTNRAARPVPYFQAEPQVTTYAARTMIWSGLIVLAFIVYHLLHFSLGVTNPAHAAMRTPEGHHDVYGMVVRGFSLWPVSIAYVVAQALLALHLAHGASSAFQTLGVTHPRLAFLKCGFGPAIAVLIFIGNVSIPIAVLAGLVPLPAGGP
jgi:succinate dehydrogenase / fumarate reductase cytochrome b subunit